MALDRTPMDDLREIFADILITHPEPCRFDHAGYCQEHYMQTEAKCWVNRVKKLYAFIREEERWPAKYLNAND